jgi:hypothetical protein
MVETYFALSFPMLDVFNVASTTDIHVLCGLDKHVIGGHNVHDRRLSRILSGDPNRYGDVIRGLAE